MIDLAPFLLCAKNIIVFLSVFHNFTQGQAYNMGVNMNLTSILDSCRPLKYYEDEALTPSRPSAGLGDRVQASGSGSLCFRDAKRKHKF